jgi:hypothetical protein
MQENVSRTNRLLPPALRKSFESKNVSAKLRSDFVVDASKHRQARSVRQRASARQMELARARSRTLSPQQESTQGSQVTADLLDTMALMGSVPSPPVSSQAPPPLTRRRAMESNTRGVGSTTQIDVDTSQPSSSLAGNGSKGRHPVGFRAGKGRLTAWSSGPPTLDRGLGDLQNRQYHRDIATRKMSTVSNKLFNTVPRAVHASFFSFVTKATDP